MAETGNILVRHHLIHGAGWCVGPVAEFSRFVMDAEYDRRLTSADEFCRVGGHGTFVKQSGRATKRAFQGLAFAYSPWKCIIE